MAYDLSFLLSTEAAEMRVRRSAGYANPQVSLEAGFEAIGAVVHVEVEPFKFEELDAEDEMHAMVLALSWIKRGAAMTAGVRVMGNDGKLGAPTIYDFRDVEAVAL